MIFRAYQKYIRTSPRKLRLVADGIRQMSPEEALVVLKFMRKRAAAPMFKVLKQAVANAKVKGAKEDDLKFVSIEVEEGPVLKRWRPVSRGRAHRILKRTSHIKIILESTAKTKSKKSSTSRKSRKDLIRGVKSSKSKVKG